MENIGILKIGCSRFLFGENALEALPEELLRYGKRVFVVGGPTTKTLVLESLRPTLAEKDVSLVEFTLDRPNSVALAKELTARAAAERTEVILAVGGGKCMDLCKVFSDLSGLPIVTVPTSIATCAACSAVSIMYTDELGAYDCSLPKSREVDSVIADTGIIGASPKRLFASGIMDSLAKLPEIVNGPVKLSYPEKSLQNYMAYSNAVVTYDFLTRFALKVWSAPQENPQLLSDLILINLIITSMISGFSSGADQLAVAHGLYDGVRSFFPAESKGALHGEIVAVGLLVQLRFNRSSKEQYDVVRGMMEQMKMPLTLAEIGVAPTRENIARLVEYNCMKNNITADTEVKRIEEAFREIL